MNKKQLLEQVERARQMAKIPVGAGVEHPIEAKWNLICQVLDEVIREVYEMKERAER